MNMFRAEMARAEDFITIQINKLKPQSKIHNLKLIYMFL